VSDWGDGSGRGGPGRRLLLDRLPLDRLVAVSKLARRTESPLALLSGSVDPLYPQKTRAVMKRGSDSAICTELEAHCFCPTPAPAPAGLTQETDMTKPEQETVFRWAAEDGKVSVWSEQSVARRKLENAAYRPWPLSRPRNRAGWRRS